ncbi:carbohydrate ABC transporter permease [Cohnella sp. GCM10012308]|uniref:carbohydrate ABC transporter permease n=1 Tax=Cohnella sp. GCM10012308 TaxID=3317329 RepID=UPI00360C4031
MLPGRADKKQLLAYAMIFPALFFFVLYLLFPLVKSLQMSFYDYDGVGPLSDFIGFGNFAEGFRDSRFYEAMGHNWILMAVELVVSMCVAFALAYFLFQGVFAWKWFNVVLFLPYIIPLAVSAVIWSLIFEPTIGMLNQLLAAVGLDSWQRVWLGSQDTSLLSVILVWVWRTIPFDMLILLGSLLKIPKELLEASKIDGCTGLRSIWHIILPLMLPTIMLLSIISIANDFRSFDIVWIMTQGGPIGSTEIASTLVYKLGFQENHYGYANAVAFMVFVIVTAMVGLVGLLLRSRNGKNERTGGQEG